MNIPPGQYGKDNLPGAPVMKENLRDCLDVGFEYKGLIINLVLS